MNNFKKILIASLTLGVLFTGAFTSESLASDPSDLVVEFQGGSEGGKLFDEANFLPGNPVERWAKVTNNTSNTWPIGILFRDEYGTCSSGELSDALYLEIKEDSHILQEGTLTWFCDSGELYLSDLTGNTTTQYDFSVTFEPDSGNNYQGKSTQFDFDIGFWGESIGGEVEVKTGNGGSGGGGGIFIAGLTISDEIANPIFSNSATINWTTNKSATSRVIYAKEGESYSFDWTSPSNYGYPHSTAEDSVKKTTHSVNVGPLEPDTTYYFRVVSHASPDTISPEFSFHTLEEGETSDTGTTETSGSASTEGITEGTSTGGIPTEGTTTEAQTDATEGKTAGISTTTNGTTTEEGEDLSSFLADIGSSWKAFFTSPWVLLLIILVLLIILLILLRERSRGRE